MQSNTRAMPARMTLALALAVAGSLPAAAPVRAQSPCAGRAVSIVVPFPPGGGTDTGARIVAEQLGRRWGQTTAASPCWPRVSKASA